MIMINLKNDNKSQSNSKKLNVNFTVNNRMMVL